MSTVTLREATEADLDEVLALYQGIEDSPERVLSLAEAKAMLAQFRAYPSYRLWVACESAEQGADVVGTYALLVMHNLAHRGAPSAVVEDVVVAADRKGQGIGRQMMAHAVQQAREAGCYKLALSSHRKRADAHAFYESLGFAQHGLSFSIEP
ncbi:GNAT family N-acetyltransferase [Acidovorax sp. sif1233]|uniref:GNAT family N-acetyltransferase n=1 Tax=Acidovorax sp. sif1233 TaxID=2854792 RepID=UPI001C4452EC|nr:GNAT family N-acetyltransferase [Acidovorax sp. sif1233]MBV7457133.1 GNAT family N-acetyltransferase [Acidovorax sp. sif1233]